MSTQQVSEYKPLRHVKQGTRFHFYGESQIWVKGHTCFRSVDMYKVEDGKKLNAFCAKTTDTVQMVND